MKTIKTCPRGIQIDAALRFFELCALVVQRIVPGTSCGSQEDPFRGRVRCGPTCDKAAIRKQTEEC